MLPIEKAGMKLPEALHRAVVLTLEEIRSHATRGKQSAHEQLVHARSVQGDLKQGIIAAAQGQLKYWSNVESGLTLAIYRAGRKLLWPHIIANSTLGYRESINVPETLFEMLTCQENHEV